MLVGLRLLSTSKISSSSEVFLHTYNLTINPFYNQCEITPNIFLLIANCFTTFKNEKNYYLLKAMWLVVLEFEKKNRICVWLQY